MSDNKAEMGANEEKAALTNEEQKQDDSMNDTRTTDLDTDKVKFINGNGSAEARVDMGSTNDDEFCGLTKEELMKYANDPYWVKVRWIMLALFWLAWLGMLVAAIIIIVLAPKCPPRPELQWWQKSAIYQCYPRSFQDTNGDGVGDIKGVERHINYLYDNNMTTVWMNSIFKSGGKDLNNDIIDHKDVDPQFGTMDDLKWLITSLHKKNMKMVLDFIPNHTSRNHTWFMESLKGGDDNKYKDYYVWHAGKNGGPPNNWLSLYGGSAWTKDPVRNEYYLHQFWPDQPDLNLRNPDVLKELEDILTFWLNEGVDGFNVIGAAHLFEGDIDQDEPIANVPGVASDEYAYLDHIQTTFQNESFAIVARWKELLDTHPDPLGNYKFLMVDVYGTPNQTMGFFENEGLKGADLPTNSELLDLKKDCNSQCVADSVHSWITNIPDNRWSNWMVGSEDHSRITTRMGESYVNAVNMLLLSLPGTPVVYYGDEIAMVDGVISASQMRDPVGIALGQDRSRDPARTPMQWTSDIYAGFSDAEPWLPVNEDYTYKNVRAQQAHGAGLTNLEVFKNLTVLRKEPSFQWGRYEDGALSNKNIYAFVRQAEGFDGFLVAINFSPIGIALSDPVADFHAARPDIVPLEGTIAATTGNIPHDRSSAYAIGTQARLDRFYIMPGEGVIIRWPADKVPKKE